MDATVVEALIIGVAGCILALSHFVSRKKGDNSYLEHRFVQLEKEVHQLRNDVREVMDALLAAGIIKPDRYQRGD